MVMSVFSATPPIEHDRVVAAIAAAEQRTSGEIRVVISQARTDEPVAVAQKQFERLGMTQTAARNGVLIFIAPASHTFAVIGDRGVHEKCGDPFWREIAEAMTQRFQRGEFTEALVYAIERAGTLLAQHFPRTPDDRNELPDAVEKI
jgi:uncharacterized membrane protein